MPHYKTKASAGYSRNAVQAWIVVCRLLSIPPNPQLLFGVHRFGHTLYGQVQISRLVWFIVQCGAECPTIRWKLLLVRVGMLCKLESQYIECWASHLTPSYCLGCIAFAIHCMAKFRLVWFIVQFGAECPTIRWKLLLVTVGIPCKLESQYVGCWASHLTPSYCLECIALTTHCMATYVQISRLVWFILECGAECPTIRWESFCWQQQDCHASLNHSM